MANKYIIQEKLDYNLLSSDEINTILQQRGHRLAVLNKDNKRYGEWQFYKNGKLEKYVSYKNGEIIKEEK